MIGGKSRWNLDIHILWSNKNMQSWRETQDNSYWILNPNPRKDGPEINQAGKRTLRNIKWFWDFFLKQKKSSIVLNIFFSHFFDFRIQSNFLKKTSYEFESWHEAMLLLSSEEIWGVRSSVRISPQCHMQFPLRYRVKNWDTGLGV